MLMPNGDATEDLDALNPFFRLRFTSLAESRAVR
jgi:hypothetical protein